MSSNMNKVNMAIGFLIAFILISCNGSRTQEKVLCEEYNYRPKVKECLTEKQIPEGYSLGEVVPYVAKDKMEKNMLSQFASYNSALLRGDFDNACHYQNKDAVEYFKQFYPGETDDDIMRKFYSSLSEEMIQTINKFEDHGIKLDFIVSRMIRKVTQGDNVIYVFELTTNMIGENLQLHTAPEETLAISVNGGKNWTFNNVNEDAPNIMRISFSEDIIDKVMGY